MSRTRTARSAAATASARLTVISYWCRPYSASQLSGSRPLACMALTSSEPIGSTARKLRQEKGWCSSSTSRAMNSCSNADSIVSPNSSRRVLTDSRKKVRGQQAHGWPSVVTMSARTIAVSGRPGTPEMTRSVLGSGARRRSPVEPNGIWSTIWPLAPMPRLAGTQPVDPPALRSSVRTARPLVIAHRSLVATNVTGLFLRLIRGPPRSGARRCVRPGAGRRG